MKKTHKVHSFFSITLSPNQDFIQNHLDTLEKSHKISCQTLTPNSDETGIRADIFIAKTLQISRSQVEKLISKEKILLNGVTLKKHGITLKPKDILVIQKEISKTNNLIKPENLEIPILYQDEDILVLNKPAGLIVHRTNQQDTQWTLVHWLQEQNFSLSNLGDSYRAGIVHRLDKGTSGAIVIAKTNFAHEHLKQQLQMRQMGRYYLCIIDKKLKESQIVDSPLIRHSKNRLKYIVANKENLDARSAKTAFFKIASANSKHYELIGAKLFSGRTHQIRAHLSGLNRHILGDVFYGYPKGSSHKEFSQDRIALHSHLLYLKHPKNNDILYLYAPPFKEMQDFLKTHFDLKSYQDSYANLIFPLDNLYQSIFS
ncbi:RluA family pseudouridine synthase [uncultured Helicobacter sp.]|uniref:RluA family pseudouridine synthase n=1 Tax=uncultured Helicobacter sp. TaxID=175537 RepID=UPI0026320BC2|nr:RluA family pseudouridine synthase [uncultured Helicobacter sp.]